MAHSAIDLKNDKANYNKTSGYTQREIDELDKLLEVGFVDSYRQLYPDAETYTFWSYMGGARAKNVGWRLDYFLLQVLGQAISKNLIRKRPILDKLLSGRD